MSDRPVVGLRYCGGCNPRFDRVAAVEQLRAQFPDVAFAPASSGQRLVLMVCGCTARCADRAGLDGELLYLCGPADVPKAVRRLAEYHL